MPLPSLYISGDKARAWSVARGAAYGAGLGALAATLKAIGPLRETTFASANAAERLVASFPEIIGAALAFALLCAGACALRNFLSRRLIWPGH